MLARLLSALFVLASAAMLSAAPEKPNVILIFIDDMGYGDVGFNGAAVGSSKPLRAKKGSVYDGGIREPTLMWWPPVRGGSTREPPMAS